MEAKMRSALSVVMPAEAACSEYSPPRARSMSVSDRATCVDDRCTIVTSAPCSHRSAQMSCAELFEPITTALRPRYSSPEVYLLEWYCSPSNVLAPGTSGTVGMPDTPVAKTRCLGRRVTGWPSRMTSTLHSPAASSYAALAAMVEPQ